MAEQLFPGVFVEEVPSRFQTIPGVSTSTTAFIGCAERGPVNVPTAITSYADFESIFGALLRESYLGFAVRDFFLNGGVSAIVVRLVHADAASLGGNSAPLSVPDFLPQDGQANKQGLYALEKTDIFNMLYIPPYRAATDPLDWDVEVVTAAAAYCESRRAMLIIDPPKDWISAWDAMTKFTEAGEDHVGTRSRNAVLYFPRLEQENPLRGASVEKFPAGGTVAGIIARTDATRGVWKAPAGLDATLAGAQGLAVALTDADDGELNNLGINCIRNFKETGLVLWGARTLAGSNQANDDYKYIPVRRTALFIEESLRRGLQWAVVEPNSELLWAQVRLSAAVFLANLFRAGALHGSTQQEAYFVTCDRTTTTQADIDRGVMNVVVGFAPFRPAEFVVIELQLLAARVDP